jgi:hypothetical protein
MRPEIKTNWHEAARSHLVVDGGQFPPYLAAVRNKRLLTSHPTVRGLPLPITRGKASLSDKGLDANEALGGLRWRRVVLRRCAGPELTSIKDGTCSAAQARTAGWPKVHEDLLPWYPCDPPRMTGVPPWQKA